MTLRLTRAQVREIDRRAVADYGIPSIVLMENAARGAADVAMEMLAGVTEPEVQIVCGGGNNGGDGLAIARHLHNRGVYVEISRAWTKPLTGDSAINLQIVEAMKIPIYPCEDAEDAIYPTDLWIDALFGTGLTRPIDGDLSILVNSILNGSNKPILAIDLPSGLDCDTGLPLGPCVRATRTVTFVADKAGFANPASREFTGEITVADIGVPPELITAVAST